MGSRRSRILSYHPSPEDPGHIPLSQTLPAQGNLEQGIRCLRVAGMEVKDLLKGPDGLEIPTLGVPCLADPVPSIGKQREFGVTAHHLCPQLPGMGMTPDLIGCHGSLVEALRT